MKYVTLFAVFAAFAMVALPIANALTVEWKPEKPKKGDVVTVYATLNAKQNQSVKLEYCINDACFFKDMQYIKGKWVGNFTLNAKKVEVKILVDGNIVWQGNIMASEKKTPSFEIPSLIIASLLVAIIWKRKRWN